MVNVIEIDAPHLATAPGLRPQITLVPILGDGSTAAPVRRLTIAIADAKAAHLALYDANGYTPPWLGYLALVDGCCVGVCGFTSPPVNQTVEISYHTFPEYERCGYARAMAIRLLRMARVADPGLRIIVHTLATENSDPRILQRVGYTLLCNAAEENDDLVWMWQY